MGLLGAGLGVGWGVTRNDGRGVGLDVGTTGVVGAGAGVGEDVGGGV